MPCCTSLYSSLVMSQLLSFLLQINSAEQCHFMLQNRSSKRILRTFPNKGNMLKSGELWCPFSISFCFPCATRKRSCRHETAQRSNSWVCSQEAKWAVPDLALPINGLSLYHDKSVHACLEIEQCRANDQWFTASGIQDKQRSPSFSAPCTKRNGHRSCTAIKCINCFRPETLWRLT